MKKAIIRVEICGGIASGKTTLARVLSGEKIVALEEQFKKNPFYAAFYRDPRGTAFETELTFLLQHYHQQKQSAADKRNFCADHSLTLDHAFAAATLNLQQLELFQLIYQNIEEELPVRSLLIHLVCPSEVALQRIKRRRRRPEMAITLSYLETVNDALNARLKQLPREDVWEIDSYKLDFARDARVQKMVRKGFYEELQSAESAGVDRSRRNSPTSSRASRQSSLN